MVHWKCAWLTRVEDRFTGGEELEELRGQSFGRILYVGIEMTKI